MGATGASVGEMATKEITVERVFDAPRERVFAMFTDPAHLQKWWGPKTYSAPTTEFEPRLGGKVFLGMRSPEGQASFNAGVVQEIVPPERVVFAMHFADAKGTRVPPSAYGLPGGWDEEIVMDITLTAEGKRTRVRIRQTGVPASFHDMS